MYWIMRSGDKNVECTYQVRSQVYVGEKEMLFLHKVMTEIVRRLMDNK